MIIYGTNSKLLKQAPLENQVCDSCNQQQSELLIYSSYAHIFWIPLFPYKKRAILHCLHCQKATEEKQMSSDKKDIITALKSSVPTPKYLFSGLVVIALLVGYLTYAGGVKQKETADFFENPNIGDVYTLKDETEPTEYKYYLWKVVDVTEDSLFVSYSSFSYNGKVKNLDPEDGFFDVYYGLDRELVREMKTKKEIVDIVRDYSESTGFNRTIHYQLDSMSM